MEMGAEVEKGEYYKMVKYKGEKKKKKKKEIKIDQ